MKGFVREGIGVGVDVAWLLAQQEQEPTTVPMHGQRGEVRRNPSADQKKVRRQMTKKQAAADEAADVDRQIAQLYRQASNPSTPDAARAELIARAEQLKTAKLGQYDLDRALDLTVKEAVEIIPQGTHELHSSSTDWLLGEGLHVTASSNEAERALVAEATLWFDRVPGLVKEDPEEFGVQARNYARRTASQYGDAAEAAAEAFVREAGRLHKQAVKTGNVKVASILGDGKGFNWEDAWDRHHGTSPDPEWGSPEWQRQHNLGVPQGDPQPAHDLSGNPGDMTDIPDPTPQPGNQDDYTTNTHEEPKLGPMLDASIPGHGAEKYDHPLTEREIGRHMTGEDANGVREHAEGFAQSQVHGVRKAASAAVVADAELAAVLAGLDKHAFLPLLLEGAEAAEGAAATESAAGEGAAGFKPGKVPGMPGGGEPGHGGSVSGDLASASDAVGGDASDFAKQQVTGASQVPQVGSSGYPVNTFPSFDGQPVEPNTSSNRSPALEELADFTGWNGTSVVPPNSGEAEAENQGLVGNRDATAPVRTASKKESNMEHAQCPTCGGHGKVAVRKQAYSGLPQIDEIVAADDSPRQDLAPGQTEHYPEQVAWPMTGWGATPEQGPANVQNAIQQAEGQIADRNGRSPLVSGTTAAQQRQANGRDNSGWLGDMGARGTDYPGNSAPVGYDGSTSEGYVDPVYGQGGEQGDRPLRPFGESEANDETNNPSQVPFPGGEYDAAQAYRTVTPSMNTQGSRDPFFAQIDAEMARLQQVRAARLAQLQQRG